MARRSPNPPFTSTHWIVPENLSEIRSRSRNPLDRDLRALERAVRADPQDTQAAYAFLIERARQHEDPFLDLRLGIVSQGRAVRKALFLVRERIIEEVTTGRNLSDQTDPFLAVVGTPATEQYLTWARHMAALLDSPLGLAVTDNDFVTLILSEIERNRKLRHRRRGTTRGRRLLRRWRTEEL